uniref:Uncharacterized protein n=1 Tax=Eutreptiella gymnastica TaxID=73025 RepID=A0A7S4G8S8_9EUGL
MRVQGARIATLGPWYAVHSRHPPQHHDHRVLMREQHDSYHLGQQGLDPLGPSTCADFIRCDAKTAVPSVLCDMPTAAVYPSTAAAVEHFCGAGDHKTRGDGAVAGIIGQSH